MSASQLAEKKIICNAKAQAIVEELIDGAETEISFLTKLRWISQNHYQDIVEERAITKICGYPLCCQKLMNIPKKQYSIILSLNKVYDISQRKHFCSNQCYKASCYLKEQLLETPLWLRDVEPEPKFKLLKNSNELLGDEVGFVVHRVDPSDADGVPPEKSSPKRQNVDPKGNSYSKTSETSDLSECALKDARISPELSSSKVGGLEIPESEQPKNVAVLNEKTDAEFLKLPQTSTVMKSSCSTENSKIIESYEVVPPSGAADEMAYSDNTRPPKSENSSSSSEKPKNIETGTVRSIIKFDKVKKKIDSADHKDAKCIRNAGIKAKNSETSAARKSEVDLQKRSEMYQSCVMKNATALVLHVEKSLREWFTVDSLIFVMGFEKVKELMMEKGKKLEEFDVTKSDPYVDERYDALCKKLKILQLQEDRFQQEVTNFKTPSKPLPDFNALRDQTKEMEIKVREFYRGDKKVAFQETNEEPEEHDRPNVIPPLHQYAKNKIRRNAVLDQLKNTIPAFASILEIPNLEISDKIKRLIFTFKFSAHNVVFKPLEWNLIILILLKLLSLHDVPLQKKLLDKSKYINAMLLNYQLENNYLDMVCVWLTDLDLILENQET